MRLADVSRSTDVEVTTGTPEAAAAQLIPHGRN